MHWNNALCQERKIVAACKEGIPFLFFFFFFVFQQRQEKYEELKYDTFLQQLGKFISVWHMQLPMEYLKDLLKVKST